MFTGIVEATGTIRQRSNIDGGIRLSIQSETILDDLAIGDSVSINGVCLTAVNISESLFEVEAVGETLSKTTTGSLAEGDIVNLERAITATTRLGGHIVQGHVNATAVISRILRRGDNFYIEIELPEDQLRYVIEEGSIAIDGISLTIAALNNRIAGFNIIPHTWTATNMSCRQVGDQVNIEVDMMAKYIERLMQFQPSLRP